MKEFFLKGGIIVGFLIAFVSSVHAQKQGPAFDSIYTHAATTLSAMDINKAIQVADSLLEHSESNVQKMKSLMLLATLKGRVGDIAEALSKAIEAEAIARSTNNHEWQVRIAGFLSTTFRGISLIAEAEKYLEIAEKANKKTKTDSPAYPIIQSFIHQEKAYYRIGEKEYQRAIEELHHAEVELSKVPEGARSVIFLGTNYQLLGACFIGLDDYRKARQYLSLALAELGDLETELKAFVYNGQGEIEMHYQDYDAAYQLFNKAEAYIETSDNLNLKSSLYKSFATYYKAIGNQEEAIRYNDLCIEVIEADSKVGQEVSNQLINQLHIEKDKKASHMGMLLWISVFLILVIILLVFLFRRVKKQERKMVEAILARMGQVNGLGEKAMPSLSPTSFNNGIAPKQGQETSIMPKETEERLLHELAKLEEDNFYLQKDISLSAMATKMQTNPKYLSYVSIPIRNGISIITLMNCG